MKRLIMALLLVVCLLVPVSCAKAPTPAPLPAPAPAPSLPEVAPPVERVAASIDDIRFEPESTGQTAIGVMSWRNTGDATHDFDVLFYLISPAGERYGPVQVEKDVRAAAQVYTATGVQLNFEGLPPGAYAVLADVYDAQTGELVASRTFDTILTLEVVGVVVPEEPVSPTPSGQMLLWTLVNPPGGGTISPSSGTQGWNKSTYAWGTKVSLTATPSPGYRFVSWSGEIQGTNPTITITMEHDWSVAANFEPISAPTPTPVTPDIGCSASNPVSSEGAVLSVTAEDGTGSTLTVPASALLSEETITITAIADIWGLPIQGTFIGGIHMAPEGLQFSTPCTLEVELPADVGAIRLVGITLPAEGVGKLKPVEVRGSKAILLIDHFSTAMVFTSEESMVDLVVRCDGGAEGQMIERDEYFESPRVKSRIKSGVDEQGREYEWFEIIETTGDPEGPHGKIWTYIDENGVEHSRIRQYNSDESLSFASDQIDGRDVHPSELDRYFTPDFATRGDPPGPDELATALERLRGKICGEEEEVKCTEIASISVSPASKQLSIGESYQLTATAKNCLLEIIENPVIAWLSSDYSVASVNTSGLVIGVSEGTATITATADGKSGSATITVITPTPSPPPAPPEDYPLDGTWEGEFYNYSMSLIGEDVRVEANWVRIVVTGDVFSITAQFIYTFHGGCECRAHEERYFSGTGMVLNEGQLIIDPDAGIGEGTHRWVRWHPGASCTIGNIDWTFEAYHFESQYSLYCSARLRDWDYQDDSTGISYNGFGVFGALQHWPGWRFFTTRVGD